MAGCWMDGERERERERCVGEGGRGVMDGSYTAQIICRTKSR